MPRPKCLEGKRHNWRWIDNALKCKRCELLYRDNSGYRQDRADLLLGRLVRRMPELFKGRVHQVSLTVSRNIPGDGFARDDGWCVQTKEGLDTNVYLQPGTGEVFETELAALQAALKEGEG